MFSPVTYDSEEWERYYRQARHTLKSARSDKEEGDYDWACFKAQQAVELALKGLIRAAGKMAVGYSLLRLLDELRSLHIPISKEVEQCCRELDKVYIPTRYPDVYTWGAPMDYFTAENASESIHCVEDVFRFLEGVMNV